MTYSLIDRLADLGTPTAEEAIAEIAAKDALIRELVGALRNIADGNPTCDSPEATASYDHVIAKAAITRAKELGYE